MIIEINGQDQECEEMSYEDIELLPNVEFEGQTNPRITGTFYTVWSSNGKYYHNPLQEY